MRRQFVYATLSSWGTILQWGTRVCVSFLTGKYLLPHLSVDETRVNGDWGPDERLSLYRIGATAFF